LSKGDPENLPDESVVPPVFVSIRDLSRGVIARE